MLTRLLLQRANWPVRSTPDRVLRLIRPESFPTARIASDTLALAWVWGLVLILALLLMFALGALRQIGRKNCGVSAATPDSSWRA